MTYHTCPYCGRRFRVRNKRSRRPAEKSTQTTTRDFLVQLRETEYIREMETRLEIESLVSGYIAYHPLSIP